MPAFQDVHECCGVTIIYGFEHQTDYISKFLDGLERHGGVNLSEGFIIDSTKSYIPMMVPGMYIIFLDEPQNKAFSTLLQKHGFELTKGPFKNPKMKNKTKIFMYTRINQFEWYSKFLSEENKKIWKPN